MSIVTMEMIEGSEATSFTITTRDGIKACKPLLFSWSKWDLKDILTKELHRSTRENTLRHASNILRDCIDKCILAIPGL